MPFGDFENIGPDPLTPEAVNKLRMAVLKSSIAIVEYLGLSLKGMKHHPNPFKINNDDDGKINQP